MSINYMSTQLLTKIITLPKLKSKDAIYHGKPANTLCRSGLQTRPSRSQRTNTDMNGYLGKTVGSRSQ